ncbi:hypothetical protein RhiirA5_436154 [Rhizophagus irregularis]|uniref:Uncharacterized protein n=1 Tax=Rhizophagus irregularis TaxID=588596 RepID=A0A2N0NMB2_9GLOM|nr:hypothetical protein RhiirA5_436154 [Rhizophagus irregularis]GET66320.1 hypothetical protein GLOIN_2v1771106 [Rhizophagus irregularis DAOM 181602=DAOM 197198]
MERVYYKEYFHLRFDVIRSPQQIQRWNHLTKVFKQLHHLPYVDAHHPSDNWRSLDPDYKKMQHRWKNWSDE